MSVNNLINESRVIKDKQSTESKQLVSKWKRSGLLDGLSEGHSSNNMARLLENQALQLLKESPSSTSPNAGTAGSDFKGDEEWSGVALPLVRRIFAEIAAQDFVSVQPMNLPSGLVFYLDFQHGTTRNGFTSGDPIFGRTGKYSPSGSSSPFPDKGFYGAGRYGYTAATGSQTIDLTAAAATHADINYDADVTGSDNAGKLWKVTGTFTSTGADKLSIRGWNLIQSGGTADVGNKVFNQFSSITGNEGESGSITTIISASSAAVAVKYGQIDYVVQTLKVVEVILKIQLVMLLLTH